jgi:hypothetical protein
VNYAFKLLVILILMCKLCILNMYC